MMGTIRTVQFGISLPWFLCDIPKEKKCAFYVFHIENTQEPKNEYFVLMTLLTSFNFAYQMWNVKQKDVLKTMVNK